MKFIITFLLLFLASQSEIQSQTKFKLEPSQSMLMTGKGPGQDGTINPYSGEDCYAIIQNTGKTSFSIRIQKNSKIIQSININKGETKQIKLLQRQELYLDANSNEKAKAIVDYKKIIKP